MQFILIFSGFALSSEKFQWLICSYGITDCVNETKHKPVTLSGQMIGLMQTERRTDFQICVVHKSWSVYSNFEHYLVTDISRINKALSKNLHSHHKRRRTWITSLRMNPIQYVKTLTDNLRKNFSLKQNEPTILNTAPAISKKARITSAQHIWLGILTYHCKEEIREKHKLIKKWLNEPTELNQSNYIRRETI